MDQRLGVVPVRSAPINHCAFLFRCTSTVCNLLELASRLISALDSLDKVNILLPWSSHTATLGQVLIVM